MLEEDFLRPLVLFGDNFRHGSVDTTGGFLADVMGPGDVTPQANRVLVFTEGDGAQVAHTEITDHCLGDLRRLLDIPRRTIADVVRHEFLRDTSGHGSANPIEVLLL